MSSRNYSYHSPQSKNKTEEDSWCSLSCLKFSLYMYNLVSLASGLAVLAISLWILLDKDQVLAPFSAHYTILAWVVLCIGALILLNTAIGCLGISRESHVLMFIYAIFCGLMILLELSGGIAGYVYRVDVYTELVSAMNTTITQDYGVSNKTSFAIDSLQSRLECCGAESFEDWQYTVWNLEGHRLNNKVPDSCCKTISRQCGVRDHPSNIYYIGCGAKLSALASNHLLLLATVATIVAVLQIVGMVLSFKLGITIRNLDE